MFGNSIASRVSRVIKQRVKLAQQEHDKFCTAADHECRDKQKKAELERDAAKESKAMELVEKIIGKGQ